MTILFQTDLRSLAQLASRPLDYVVTILTDHNGKYLFMPLEVMLLQRFRLPTDHTNSHPPRLGGLGPTNVRVPPMDLLAWEGGGKTFPKPLHSKNQK